MSPKRPNDRDVFVLKHQSPAAGVPVEVERDITGNHSGDDLRELRSRRPTGLRLELLEEKHDHLAAAVTDMHLETTAEFGDIKATLGEVAGAVKGLTTVVENSLKRDHVTFSARVEVDKAGALDVIDAKKSKRELYAKLVGSAASGGILFEILHRLGVL